MKKVFRAFALLAVIFTMCAVTAFAEDSGKIKVFINNAEKNFSPSAMLMNDRTMVPLRGIFEELNAKVDWLEATQTISITKDSTTITLTIGKNTATINGEEKTLDTPPVVIEDRTMVPLRFISEALSCDVYWDGTRNAVDIYSIETGDGKDTNGRLSRKSVFNEGDTSAIENAMLKAKSGQDITIGFIGGSITEKTYSTAKQRYTYFVEQWWREKFPNINVNVINAGIGSTGSLIGVHRVDANILNKKPDFVIVEYAVNDDAIKKMQIYYEQLVRKVLKSENKPGLMLVFMLRNDGFNCQKLQGEVGMHYNLPMISFKDAMWPEFRAKNLQWNDFFVDTVHPNEAGHYLVAKFITDKLNRIYEGLGEKKEIPPVKDVLFAPEKFVDAKTLCSDTITPLSKEGWAVDSDKTYAYNWIALMPPGWEINVRSKPVVFEVEGNTIGVVYKKTNINTGGRVSVKIDDLAPVILESFVPGGWGKYPMAQIIGDDLPDDKHRVEITLLDEHNKDSTGETFTVNGILTSKIIK